MRGRTKILDESYLKAIKKMIADGLNNNEMAERLNVTGKTIGNFKREYGLINTNLGKKPFTIGNKIYDWKAAMDGMDNYENYETRK